MKIKVNLAFIGIVLLFQLLCSVTAEGDLRAIIQQKISASLAKAPESTCIQDYSNYLLRNTSLVLSLLDATAKIPSGILRGDTNTWGDYDECISLKPVAHYCLYTAKLQSLTERNTTFIRSVKSGSKNTGNSNGTLVNLSSLPQLSWGLCVPSSCTEADLDEITVFLQSLINDYTPYDFNFVGNDFVCIPDYPMTTGAILTIVLLCVLASLVAVATVFDMKYPNFGKKKEVTDQTGLRENLLEKEKDAPLPKAYVMLRSFSLMYNLPRLLSTGTRGQITALNGIRVISICWVILCHTYDWSLPIIKNQATELIIAKRMSFQIVTNGWFSVDSFLFLSGFLLAFIALKELRKKGRISWIMFYFHRLWRLTPVYFVVILIFWKLNIFWVDGPSSIPFESQSGVCDSYWWANLLYINNFYPGQGGMCIGASWYLAIDMQFFVLSPIFLLGYYKSKVLGWALMICASIASWVVTAIITHQHNYQGYMVLNFLSSEVDYMDHMYNKPYTRLSPYLVGVATAFMYVDALERKNNQIKDLLAINQNEEQKPHPPHVDDLSIPFPIHISLTGLLFGGFLMLFMLFSTYSAAQNMGWSEPINILYTTFSRFVWAIGLALVVFFCATGNGGLVNTVLSLPIFTILSKLTYLTYLVHSIVLNAVFYNINQPIYYHDFIWVILAVGTMTFSFACAFVLNLMVEMPLINMEKVFLH